MRILLSPLPLLFILSGCSTGASPKEPAPIDEGCLTLLPGVLADRACKTAFAKGEDGSIVAIDLKSGAVVWRSEEKLSPLILLGRRLLASETVDSTANALRLVLLDVDQGGGRAGLAELIEFPEWVSVLPTAGRSFALKGDREDGQPVLVWEAGSSYAGGARPTQQILARETRGAAGVIHLDAVSGAVLGRTSREPKRRPLEGVGASTDKTAPYWNGIEWSREPIVVDGVRVALELAGTTGHESLSVRHWKEGDEGASETVELGTGRSLHPVVSSDLRHIFVHDKMAAMKDGTAEWRAYSLPDGRLEATVPFRPGTLAAVAVDSKIIVLIEDSRLVPGAPGRMLLPRRLEAIDLETGETAWSVPIEARVRLRPAR